MVSPSSSSRTSISGRVKHEFRRNLSDFGCYKFAKARKGVTKVSLKKLCWAACVEVLHLSNDVSYDLYHTSLAVSLRSGKFPKTSQAGSSPSLASPILRLFSHKFTLSSSLSLYTGEQHFKLLCTSPRKSQIACTEKQFGAAKPPAVFTTSRRPVLGTGHLIPSNGIGRVYAMRNHHELDYPTES